MGYNLKPTTPQELDVIAWTMIAVLVVIALTAVVFLGRAETAQQATELRWIATCSAALAAVIRIGRRWIG